MKPARRYIALAPIWSPSIWSRTPTWATIVDAGLPGQWNELEPELTSMGRSLNDIVA